MNKAEVRKLKKGVELIRLVVYKIQMENSLSCVHQFRDAFHHVFFNDKRLDEIFLWILPVEQLDSISRTLLIMSSLHSSSTNDISSMYGTIKKENLMENFNIILTHLENQIRSYGFSIFYSWQSDLPNNTNRNFIEDALKKAIDKCIEELKIPFVFDKDTTNRTGSPDIAQTILEKISNSFMFIADVSIVVESDKRKCPNPNVMLELGYAQGTIGEENIIIINNNAYGNIEELPFDLRGKRIMQYECSEHLDSDKRKGIKKELINRLYNAIKARALSEIA